MALVSKASTHPDGSNANQRESVAPESGRGILSTSLPPAAAWPPGPQPIAQARAQRRVLSESSCRRRDNTAREASEMSTRPAQSAGHRHGARSTRHRDRSRTAPRRFRHARDARRGRSQSLVGICDRPRSQSDGCFEKLARYACRGPICCPETDPQASTADCATRTGVAPTQDTVPKPWVRGRPASR